jgi:hypothetical protein
MLAKAEACGLEVDRNCVVAIDKPQANPFGTLYNSQTVWYKITGLGDYIRPMGQGSHETVASTAVDRSENPDCKYKPENLTKFIADGGPVKQIAKETPVEI